MNVLNRRQSQMPQKSYGIIAFSYKRKSALMLRLTSSHREGTLQQPSSLVIQLIILTGVNSNGTSMCGLYTLQTNWTVSILVITLTLVTWLAM
jgi:hypothetical protein